MSGDASPYKRASGYFTPGIVGNSEVGQKRVSGRSLSNLREADFWPGNL